jgi:anti-sigma regulatory factor (Ser/Thr protein kinase)
VNADSITVPATADQLPQLTRFLQDFWRSAALPAPPAMTFELALEEIFMNVVMHGSPPGTSLRVTVSLELQADTLAMTVEDDGPQFDPLSLPPADTTSPLAERRVGGHGVSLVRSMMDQVTYQRAAGLNRLRMSRQVFPDPAPPGT